MGGFLIMAGTLGVALGIYFDSILMIAGGFLSLWIGHRILDKEPEKDKGESNAD